MKTIEDIKHLRQDLLTTSNALRGLENLSGNDHILTLSNNIEGHRMKLKKLEDIVDHAILSDQLKDSYIIDELKKRTREVSTIELAELLEDDDDSYYTDASIEWIYDYIYELFADDATITDIDNRLAYTFGYYTSNISACHDGQFYIFLEY